ncbi:type 2 lanthipeptide synthetase LanM [Paenibacillus thiaminolyticus]|uniref:type 2 lanthipeptide synthetase LanM n=1 Tax=Paenibacillus thiaminolyticus TaxID=49283 RepID=UPI003D2B68CC
MKKTASLYLLREEDLIALLKQFFALKHQDNQKTEQYFDHFYAPFRYILQVLMEEALNDFVTSGLVNSSYYNAIRDEFLHKLREVSTNTLLTELNINRLSGTLKGDTKEERYAYFEMEILGQESGFFEILEEYPELLSLIVLYFNQFIDEQTFILNRVRADYREIKAALFQDDFIIEGYQFGVGDPHNNGKNVKIIKTNLGPFVYKPKSMNIETNFNKLIDWVNLRSILPKQQLKYPKVVCKDGYGWQQFIRNNELGSQESAHDFYYRQGMNIALMYVLNAGDFHYENLIADGSYPVLIDIETLFSNMEPAEVDEETKSFQSSVMYTMMLPMDYGEIMDFEISGLSGKEGQVSRKHSALNLVNHKSDEMKFVKTPFVLKGKSNIPAYDGQKMEAQYYIDDICDGFTYCYQLLSENKSEFLNLICIFNNDIVRVVLRPTQTYSEFLLMGKYPKNLVSFDKRRELFNELIKTESDKFPYEIIQEEIKSLENEDVPYFYTYVNDTSIHINDIRVDDYFPVSPLGCAMEKVNQLSDEDLKLQVKFIRLSLGFELTKNDADFKYIHADRLRKIDRKNRLEMKEQIDYWMDDILQKSIKFESGRLQWLSHVTDSKHRSKLGYMLYSLYDGITGMAITFGLLSKYIDEGKYAKYYDLMIQDIMNHEEKVLEYENTVCGLGNTGSIIYTYLYLGKLRNDAALISRAVELAHNYCAKVIGMLEEKDIEIDFTSGLSSLLVILCRVTTKVKTEPLIEAIAHISDYIVKQVEKEWKEGNYRTGFAHGYTGIAFALHLASTFTNIPDKVIEELIRRENEKYDAEANRWCDTRENDNQYSEDYWCQGSVGMYIPRMQLSSVVPNDLLMLDVLRENAKQAIQQLTNFSLCHGYTGNVLLLKYFDELSVDHFYLPNSYDQYVGGVGTNAESVGLFLGEAGLLYFLICMLREDISMILYLEV